MTSLSKMVSRYTAGKDQANALHTDTETPFKNQRDTYRRLLRYHVFQTKNPPNDLVKKGILK